MNSTTNERWFVQTHKALIYSLNLINLEYLEKLLIC
jgi:hypothetical protein